jgi:hypothetical protein
MGPRELRYFFLESETDNIRFLCFLHKERGKGKEVIKERRLNIRKDKGAG